MAPMMGGMHPKAGLESKVGRQATQGDPSKEVCPSGFAKSSSRVMGRLASFIPRALG